MREIRALIRVSWQMALSYRVSVVLSLVALLFRENPIYYVARALQPELATHIANQGGEYFAFLLVGLIGLWFISAAVNLVPHIFSSGIANGTLEALLATRTSRYSSARNTVDALTGAGMACAMAVNRASSR